MNAKDFNGTYPSAFLFCNGAGMYFDKEGEQIPHMQRLGLSGVHRFVDLYPDAPVHWCVWKKSIQLIPKECLDTLMYYINIDPEDKCPC